MPDVRGEFIAIFDADFVPSPDFFKKAIPFFADQPRTACVQGRWAHLNETESWLTQAQSLGIDTQFAIEQPARAWNDYLLNFNGTGGIWRRAAIDDPAVGGREQQRGARWRNALRIPEKESHA